MEDLISEFDRYLANREEMLANYEGKFLALKGGVVLGAYDSYGAAVFATRREHERGTYLIQEIAADEEALAAIFSSPSVTFR